YACAVSVAGISDLAKLLRRVREEGGLFSQYLSFWQSRIGSTDDDNDQLRATSPARHADLVKCPILLLHSDADSNVPISQSELMSDALKSAGKEVRLVVLEGNDHDLR